MSKSITTLLTFLSRLSSSYGNPTEPGLTRSQCSAATHGGGAVKLPVLLKLVLEDHQHEPLRLLPVLVKPRKTAQQCTGGIGGWPAVLGLIHAGKLVSAHRQVLGGSP